MSDDEDNPAAYGDTHRAFLQALLSRQTITYPDAIPILSAILTAAHPDRPTLEGDITQDGFQEYMDILHDAVSPFDFEIRSMENQTTHERVWALVNTTSDALTQIATVRTADEMAFVKRVLDRMFDTGNSLRSEVYGVKSTEALKLKNAPAERDEETQGGKVTSLTMTEAEKVLDTMLAEGWFQQSPSGFYSPTERLLMELNRWLRDVYNDDEDEDEDVDDQDNEEGGRSRKKIKDCVACRSILTIGHRCPNLPCEVRLHDHCMGRFFSRARQKQCPTCKTDWSDPLPVGERAMRNGGAVGRRSTNGTRSSITVNRHADEDSDATADTD